jgi:choloylglycine hydrolase
MEAINMLTLMREVLDSSANVDEAVEIIGRYNVLMEGGQPIHYLIADASGQCSAAEAMALLNNASQESTQWSVVYNLSTREIDIVVGGHYAVVHTFQLEE